jgi:hypothetical protein
MKKKYLFLLLFVSLFSSCSDEDDKQNLDKIETITTRINGQSVEFKNFTITKQDYTDSETNYQWTDVSILGYIEEDPLNSIEIIAEQGALGTESIWRFNITYNGILYSRDNSLFTTIVTKSNENSLQGSFSGNLKHQNTGEIITLTEGIFRVKF